MLDSISKLAFLASVTLFFLLGCGGLKADSGSTGSSFPPAGTILSSISKTVTSGSGAPVILQDNSGTITVTTPSPRAYVGQTMTLTIWSKQRELQKADFFDISANAYDLTLQPTGVYDTDPVLIKLPWKHSDNNLAVMIVARGPSGKEIALQDGSNFTTEAPTAILDRKSLMYILDGKIDQSTVHIYVAEVKESKRSKSHEQLDLLYSSPTSRTNYSDKRRIAVVLHGIRSDSGGVEPARSFLASVLAPMDGKNTLKSLPFDSVYSANYDWTEPISVSAGKISDFLSAWKDPSKFEVHIYAYSMGGLVARYITEKIKIPSIYSVTTLGTPHAGISSVGIKNLTLFSTTANLYFNVLYPGIRDLFEDSQLIKTLKTTPSSGVRYTLIAGHSPFNLYLNDEPSGVDVGSLMNIVYNSAANDGIVLVSSATAFNGSASLSVKYNHIELIKKISSYFPSYLLTGMNRKIHRLDCGPYSFNIGIGMTQKFSWTIRDKDNSVIDPVLIGLQGDKLPITWRVDNPEIISVDATSGILSGLKKGSTHVYARLDVSNELTESPPVEYDLYLTVTYIREHFVGRWSYDAPDCVGTGIFNSDGTYQDSNSPGRLFNYEYTDLETETPFRIGSASYKLDYIDSNHFKIHSIGVNGMILHTIDYHRI